MTKFTEGRHPGEFLLSEAEFHRSRGVATIASGSGVVEAGTVVGKVTRGAITVTKTDVVGASKGVLTLAEPAYGAGVKNGDYKVVIVEPATDAGKFVVEDPDGIIVGTGTVGAAFDGVVKFTLADGTSDHVSGDYAVVHVAVAAGSGYFAPSPAAEDDGIEGAEIALAVTLYRVDATSEAVDVTIIERDAQVKGFALIYDASVDDDAKKQAKNEQLKAAGIIVR